MLKQMSMNLIYYHEFLHTCIYVDLERILASGEIYSTESTNNTCPGIDTLSAKFLKTAVPAKIIIFLFR